MVDKIAVEDELFACVDNRYTFCSFAHLQVDSGRNIGCCIVKAGRENALSECTRLELVPDVPYDLMMFPLPTLEHEEMELNRFYSREEMAEFGYGKIEVDGE